MNYPDLDMSPVETATGTRTRLLGGIAETETKIQALLAAQNTHAAERSRQIDLAARGEAVPAESVAELETKIRHDEAELLRHQQILTRQNSMVADAEKEVRAARGLAHRPRVILALQELRDGNSDWHAAQTALNAANRRMDAAKAAIFEAFGAGHPMPSTLPKQAMAPAEFHRAMWPDLSERGLRRAWGELAVEAFGPAVEAA
jgi:TolA-binding protein